MSEGILTFSSIAAALGAGFSIYGRNDTGFIVRKMTPEGWQMALVVLK